MSAQTYIDSACRDPIKHLLYDFVNQSPVKKLYVQIRRQGLERDKGTSKNSSHEESAESFPFARGAGSSPKNLRRG